MPSCQIEHCKVAENPVLVNVRQHLFEVRGKRAKRTRTMTVDVLLGARELGKRDTELGEEEERIVTKTAGAPACVADHARAGTDRRNRVAARPDERRSAYISRASLVFGNVAEPRDEQIVVGFVGVAVFQTMICGEALGTDAWKPAQRIDHQTGIVGQNGATGARGEVRSFGNGVIDERVVLFDVIFG